MPKRKTQEEFIAEAKVIHGDKYDYSKVEYKNRDIPIEIICSIHGKFIQRPHNHVNQQQGCPKCGIISRGNKRSYTTEEFIEKAKLIHGCQYNYNKVNYINSRKKVCIICSKHGEFSQSPSSHLMGQGCFLCGRDKTTKFQILQINQAKNEFIQKSNLIHGEFYDYSKVKYTGSKNTVIIICPKHGEFLQIPNVHLGGHGCLECGYENNANAKRKELDAFVQESRLIHGDKYDYSKVDYTSNKDKIKIICTKHGEFKISPYNFLKSTYGCQKCGFSARGESKRLTNKEFVNRSKEMHGDKYSYRKTKYIKSDEFVIISCLKHGDFKQKAINHLIGNGCPICQESKGEKQIRLYLEEHKIIFQPQYQFKTSEIAKSRFDFGTRKGLIEYHGKQHYIPCSFGSKKKHSDIRCLIDTMNRDLKKEYWCKKHKIPLLVIPYWDFDRISEILDDFLSKKESVLSEPPELVVKYKPMRKKILEWLKSQQNLNMTAKI